MDAYWLLQQKEMQNRPIIGQGQCFHVLPQCSPHKSSKQRCLLVASWKHWERLIPRTDVSLQNKKEIMNRGYPLEQYKIFDEFRPAYLYKEDDPRYVPRWHMQGTSKAPIKSPMCKYRPGFGSNRTQFPNHFGFLRII